MRPKIDSWATHLPMLVRCVAYHRGPILEMGCGLYSTPVLHAMSHGLQVPLTSIERNPEWGKPFTKYVSPLHDVIIDNTPNKHLQSLLDHGEYFHVALVDHSPAVLRAQAVKMLANKCDLIVCHDSEHRLYDYEDVLSEFEHRVEWREYAPWTTVVSNTMDLSFLKDLT